jgi:hypothetical protein
LKRKELRQRKPQQQRLPLEGNKLSLMISVSRRHKPQPNGQLKNEL